MADHVLQTKWGGELTWKAEYRVAYLVGNREYGYGQILVCAATAKRVCSLRCCTRALHAKCSTKLFDPRPDFQGCHNRGTQKTLRYTFESCQPCK